MNTKLKVLATALIAGGTMFAQTRLSVGVNLGGYGPGAYPPPAYAQYQPPCPGPDYTWVDGYWAFESGRNVWIDGFWQAPVVRFAPRYVAPRYVAPRYVAPRYVEPRFVAPRDNTFHGGDRDRNRAPERHERNDNHGNSNGFRR